MKVILNFRKMNMMNNLKITLLILQIKIHIIMITVLMIQDFKIMEDPDGDLQDQHKFIEEGSYKNLPDKDRTDKGSDLYLLIEVGISTEIDLINKETL